jgi:hypothetical protein
LKTDPLWGGRWAGVGEVLTTMIYTHVLNRGGWGVCRPLDSTL